MAKKTKKSEVKSNNKLIRTLGIDLSIGRVKLSLLTYNNEDNSIGGNWSSIPVEFEFISEKNYEFSRGLTLAIEAFLKHHSIDSTEINSIVFCTGGAYYMFKSFAEGMRYTGGIIKMIFPRQKVYFIRCDGELININDIFELPDDEASAFCCTNFLGTSLIAAKTFPEGLAIDMGTISTSIIPIIDNKIDPVASYNPKGYVNHRYTTGKHIWYGVMNTHLNYITTQASTRRNNYNLILRSCTTNTLCSILGLIEPDTANVHVYNEYKIEDKEMDFIRLAETVGLDINSVSKEELIDIAASIYSQMLYKLADIIRNIIANMNYKNFDDLKVLASGLGQKAFIIPALNMCGFDDHQIITVTESQSSNLWTATSVYGLSLTAMEELIGKKIDISLGNFN